jgi:glutamate racemase
VSDDRPIGVFDSGIGGLTVLRALLQRLPNEDYIYLGDTARVPYGTKGVATVQRFAREATTYLLALGVKRIVVACNTASALAMEAMRELSSVPVEGVIEPGVDAALRATRGKVGVIGTLATVGSDRYQQGLLAQRPDLEVLSKPCPLFVPLAEEGWVDGSIPEEVAETYLAELREAGVDTVILGCTHYPILKGVIGKVMGEGVSLVDSALVLADAVADDLASTQALSSSSQTGSLRLLVSDVPQRFGQLSRRFLAYEVSDAELVDIEAPPLPATD